MRIMSKENGFTLLELMVVLAVSAVVLSLGVPGFRAIVQDSRMVADTNQFVSSISLARSSAVRHQRNATICTSSDYAQPTPTCSGSTDWTNGWVVYVDKDRDGTIDADEVVSVQAPLDDGVTMTAAAANRFTYNAQGFGQSAGDSLLRCDGRSGETGRRIAINAAGRATVAEFNCS